MPISLGLVVTMGSLTHDLCHFSHIKDCIDIGASYHVDGCTKGLSKNLYGKSARFKSRYHRDFLIKKAKPRLRFMAYKLELDNNAKKTN